MGSANGRHRRPRQAPAIVVAAGVTGSAIAIPLLGASGAHAAEATTWDRVAECESGGMWSADLGNGFYGGLQFSQETWSTYGGTDYAPRADLASRSQQIAVAEKILDDQGPGAWPGCAVISGLAADGGLPGVDPGATPSDAPAGEEGAAPVDEADAPGKADPTPTPDASGQADADPAPDPSGGADGVATGERGDGSESDGVSRTERRGAAADAPSAPTAPPASGAAPGASQPSTAPDASAGGKHRGAPAPEEAGAAGREDGLRESGRHASRGEGAARDGGAAVAGDYTVRAGDNLWSIADAQELPEGWAGLYETNKGLIGSDPDLILPGQSLDLGLGQGLDQDGVQGSGPTARDGAEEPADN
ncbi:transglycosylase family protein [Streptomyces pratensis]|uniref:transglycosylase family protein n=1 Tax=Streptomyces pratensis TaxID=1169025 RepID=UPI003016A735